MFQIKPLAVLAALAACLLSGCDESPSEPAATGRITFTSPAKGAALKVGDSLRVRWITKDDVNDPFTSVQVLLSNDDGKTFYQLINKSVKPGTAEWEKVAWLIADSLEYKSGSKIKVSGCTACRVKVMEYSTADPEKIAVSEAFTVNP
jgi:hypothetical protein